MDGQKKKKKKSNSDVKTKARKLMTFNIHTLLSHSKRDLNMYIFECYDFTILKINATYVTE